MVKNLGGDKGYISKKMKTSLKNLNTNHICKLERHVINIASDKLVLKKRITVEHTLFWNPLRYISNEI